MTGRWAVELGFQGVGESRWTRSVRGREVVFRELRTLAEMTPVEGLQREVMGASELDVMPASGLIVIPETGGAVIAAEVDGEVAGALWGFGGFVEGRARIVSDWMGVRATFRSLGLGAELKRLQAALALAAGLELIVWTVDPLRAANARLNIAKLGAISRRYEIDRYGAYAPGLYGDMPTDRLHMEWDLREPHVQSRLRSMATADPGEPDRRGGKADRDVRRYDQDTGIRSSTNIGARRSGPSGRDWEGAVGMIMPPVMEGGTVDGVRRRVAIPADIDALVHDDPDTALAWRLRVREQLQAAFAEGFVLDGYEPGEPSADPALVLTARGRSVGKGEAE